MSQKLGMGSYLVGILTTCMCWLEDACVNFDHDSVFYWHIYFTHHKAIYIAATDYFVHLPYCAVSINNYTPINK